MYGKIEIEIGSVSAQFSTLKHDEIYDFLIGHGYTHCEAADVADWAELASIGEEYELHDAKIIIEE